MVAICNLLGKSALAWERKLTPPEAGGPVLYAVVLCTTNARLLMTHKAPDDVGTQWAEASRIFKEWVRDGQGALDEPSGALREILGGAFRESDWGTLIQRGLEPLEGLEQAALLDEVDNLLNRAVSDALSHSWLLADSSGSSQCRRMKSLLPIRRCALSAAMSIGFRM